MKLAHVGSYRFMLPTIGDTFRDTGLGHFNILECKIRYYELEVHKSRITLNKTTLVRHFI